MEGCALTQRDSTPRRIERAGRGDFVDVLAGGEVDIGPEPQASQHTGVVGGKDGAFRPAGLLGEVHSQRAGVIQDRMRCEPM